MAIDAALIALFTEAIPEVVCCMGAGGSAYSTGRRTGLDRGEDGTTIAAHGAA
jgi:hypothetical protein